MSVSAQSSIRRENNIAPNAIQQCEILHDWHPPGRPDNKLTQITLNDDYCFFMTEFPIRQDDYAETLQGFHGIKVENGKWAMKLKEDNEMSPPELHANFNVEDYNLYEACVIKRSSDDAESKRRVMQEADVMNKLRGRSTNILLPTHIWKDKDKNYYRIIPEHTLLDDMIYDIKGMNIKLIYLFFKFSDYFSHRLILRRE